MKFKIVSIIKFCIVALFVTGNISAAEKEWREVFRMDFGGDDVSDPAMSTVEPSSDELITDLKFSGSYQPEGSVNKYFIVKNTAVIERGSTSAMNKNHWVDGSDHTYPNDKTRGYCMMFDAAVSNDELKVFEKSLPISCSGVNFRFSCWFANLAQEGYDEDCEVTIGIYSPDGKLLDGGDVIEIPASSTGELSWNEHVAKFKVPDDADYSSVLFKIYAVSTYQNAAGWDFAMDDILIEVEQPVLAIKNEGEFAYKKPVDIVAEYDMESFKNFFGDDFSNVKYRWEYSTSKKGPWTTKASGSYSAGSSMPYTINSFEKDNQNGQGNGFYKLTVASAGNMDNGFCSIQQIFEINEKKDKCYITLCQEGNPTSKEVLGYTLTTADAPKKEYPSVDFFIDVYKYTKKDEIEETCLNEDNPVPGKKFVETKNEFVDVDSETRCVSKKTDYYLNVVENASLPAHNMCVGEKDPNGTLQDRADETGLKEITVEQDNCTYKQVLLIHPTYDMPVTQVVCLDESYQGKKYDKAGSYQGNRVKLKSVYGCDSIITPTIIVPERIVMPLVEMDPVCQGEATVSFNGKLYSDPMDKIVRDTLKSEVTGCDSIVSAHIVIYPSGQVGPFDTLICRDQILFGDEYTVPGKYRKINRGLNSLGCPNDTIWDIEVVEVQLKLRVAFLGDNPVICKGTPLELRVTLLPEDADFRWEPNIGTNSIKPVLWPDKTTTYTAYADLDLPSDIDHNAKGCHAKAEITVDVHPQPFLSIDSVDVDSRNVEYSVDGGTLPYNLLVDGKTVISESNDMYGTLEKQPFGSHTMQIVDSIGCTSEADFSIVAKPIEPETLFTPNFDGVNDRWVIHNIDVYPNARVRVYDRLGRIVYNCEGGYDNENGFDGTYNGNKLPTTDYWYEIDVEELDVQYVGHFTLLR